MLLLALTAAFAADPTSPPTRIQVQLGHTFPISDVAWSPDGALVATAGGDETVRLWDVATGRLLRVWPTDGEPAVGFAGGDIVVADPVSGRRYDLRTGELLGEAGVPYGGLPVVAPDGAQVAFASASPAHVNEAGWYTCTMFTLADPAAGESGDTVLAEDDSPCPEAVAWDLAGGTLVATDTSFTRVRSVAPGGAGPHDLAGSGALALSDDGKTLAAGMGGVGLAQPHLTLWDLATGERLARWKKAMGEHTPSELAVSPDGRRVIASDDWDHLVLYELGSRKPVWRRELPSSVLAFSPAGRYALAGHRRNGDNDIDVLRAADGSVATSFVGRTPAAASVAFAGGRALVGGDDGSLAIWSLETLGLERTVLTGATTVMEIAADGDRAVIVPFDAALGYGRSPQVWDVARGVAIGEIPAPDYPRSAALLASGGVVVGTTSGHLVVTGPDLAVTKTVEGLGPVNAVAVSPDGKRLAACAGDLVVWDVGSWDAPAWSTPFGYAVCRAVAWSPDGGRVVVSGSGDPEYPDESGEWVEVWEPGEDLVARWDLEPEQGVAMDVAYLPDGRVLIADERGAVVIVHPDEYGEAQGTVHLGPVNDLAVSPDGLVLDAGLSDAARLWRPGQGAVQLAADDRGEWVIFSDEGWFDASREGGDLVAVVQGTDVWGIDQFATQANRPDLLLASVGLGSPELLAHWKARYDRRLKKLGVAARGMEDGADVPTVAITEARTSDRSVDVTFSAADAAHDLVRYDVYVNDVPVHAGGKPLSGREATITEPVPLTMGDNVVEVAVVNAAGVESRRAMRSFRSEPVGGPAPRGDLWIVAFGVSDYADPRLQDLGYADDDARDLAAAFAAMPGFGEVHTRVLTDASVTPSAVDDARSFLAGAGVDDTIVVFVAGHGLHDRDTDATYYFLGHDANLDRLAETAISFERVEALLQGVAPRRKLLLLDTCESGEAEDEGVAVASADVGSARGVRVSTAASGAAPPPRPWLWARDRFVYNDLSRRTGAIVFSSSRGGEYSFESADLGHGYFTAELLAGLQGAADADHDGEITVSELREHVAAAVAERSRDRQHPVVDRDNLKARFGFPASGGD